MVRKASPSTLRNMDQKALKTRRKKIRSEFATVSKQYNKASKGKKFNETKRQKTLWKRMGVLSEEEQRVVGHIKHRKKLKKKSRGSILKRLRRRKKPKKKKR